MSAAAVNLEPGDSLWVDRHLRCIRELNSRVTGSTVQSEGGPIDPVTDSRWVISLPLSMSAGMANVLREITGQSRAAVMVAIVEANDQASTLLTALLIGVGVVRCRLR